MSTKSDIKEAVGNSRIAQFMPDQSQRQKLDRFEQLTRGSATSSTQNTKLLFDVLEDKSTGSNLTELLHGPMYGHSDGNSAEFKTQILDDLGTAARSGQRHLYWMKMQDLNE